MWSGTSADRGWALGLERGQGEDGCGQDLPVVQGSLINRKTNWNVPFLLFHLLQVLGMRKEASKKCWHFSEKQRGMPLFFFLLFSEKFCHRDSARLLCKKILPGFAWCSNTGVKQLTVPVHEIAWSDCASKGSNEILPKCPRLHSLHPFPVKPFKCCFKN